MEAKRNRQESARHEERGGLVLVTEDVELAELAGTVAAAAALELSVVARAAEWEGGPPRAWLLGPGHRGPVPAGESVFVVSGPETAQAAWALGEERGGLPVVLLPEAGPWLVRRLLSGAASGAGGRVVGILSASGGVGCTSMAALAGFCAAREGARVLVVEGDPLGSGLIDAMGMGLGESRLAEGITWEDLCRLKGLLNPEEFAAMLPAAGPVRFLARRSPLADFPPGSAVASVLTAARQAFELVLVDLGHGYKSTGSLVEACEESRLVVPSHAGGVEAARHLATALGQRRAACVVASVRRGMSVPPPEVVAEIVGLPLAARWPHRPAVGSAGERGALEALAGTRWARDFTRSLLVEEPVRTGAGHD